MNSQSRPKTKAAGKSEARTVVRRKGKRTVSWTKEEDDRIFALCKEFGTSWSIIAGKFPGRTENQIKNRFYSTLRRVATKKIAKERLPYKSSIQMGKLELLRYVDDALLYGRDCYSRRGRKKKVKHIRSNALNREPKEQSNEEKKLETLPSISAILKTAKTSLTYEGKVSESLCTPSNSVPTFEVPSLPHSSPLFFNALPRYCPPAPPLVPQFLFVNSRFPMSCQLRNQPENRHSGWNGWEAKRSNEEWEKWVSKPTGNKNIGPDNKC